ncbi:MAG: helix-turn-helix domain-containing protein [Candidatus Thiodiazotropha sp.]
MSRCIRGWAWEQKISPTLKLVLLALAEYISEEADRWPSEKRLEQLTGLPGPVVIKAIKQLEAKGLILCLRLCLIREKGICCGDRLSVHGAD